METNKKGKLIVIEGFDGCGKNTQAKLLVNKLQELGIKSKLLTFPNYESVCSGPVQMYLNGQLGNIYDVSSKQASLLYAVDRFCTVRAEGIDKLLDDGWFIICDRYVESNMIHQAVKHYGDKEKVLEIVTWIENLEYNDLGLPRPDCTIFLDVLPEVSANLRQNRLMDNSTSKVGNVNRNQDIHEIDNEYLKKSYLNGVDLAKELHWIIINCNKDIADNRKTIMDIEMIHHNIMSYLYQIELIPNK